MIKVSCRRVATGKKQLIYLKTVTTNLREEQEGNEWVVRIRLW